MSRNLSIVPLQTTLANLVTQAGGSALVAGELYYVTDKKKHAVALTTSTWGWSHQSFVYTCTSAIDKNNGQQQKITLTGDITFTFTNFVEGDFLLLTITSDASVRAVTLIANGSANIRLLDTITNSFNTIASKEYQLIFRAKSSTTFDVGVVYKDL